MASRRETEPSETFQGVLTVLKGTMVTVLGAHLRDYKRELIAKIHLVPGPERARG